MTIPRWTRHELSRFLEIRQEFFLDPLGSNRERMVEAAVVLQRALFAWYLANPGDFKGMLPLVQEHADAWRVLRQRERETLDERRFTLHGASPAIPSVEGGVSEDQAQRITAGLSSGIGTLDRLLAQLDESSNPSLRVNHRYMGELLPHDNMISFFAAVTATFLNENAIIGKVSPCVTHMEQAVARWLITLVGWDSGIEMDDGATSMPVQRLWTPYPPSRRAEQWEREQPTGSIVSGGTIANITALTLARNAVFNYLLHWDDAVQQLGPMLAWEIIKEVWGYRRCIVVTSQGAHYSIEKAALQIGVGGPNFVKLPGSANPWVLDAEGLEAGLAKFDLGHRPYGSDAPRATLLLAVCAIAGKTETGDVDRIAELARALNGDVESFAGCRASKLPAIEEVRNRRGEILRHLKAKLARAAGASGETGQATGNEQAKEDEQAKRIIGAFQAAVQAWDASDAASPPRSSVVEKHIAEVIERTRNPVDEVRGASHNRAFLHVDAAHGGAYLCVPELRAPVFAGIELADSVTLDGHKMFYCYYPCGGLVVRATRWAKTLTAHNAAYISEEENHHAYGEDRYFLGEERRGQGDDREHQPLIDEHLLLEEHTHHRLASIRERLGRPNPRRRAELTHTPFHAYLEGSRGSQGIMQFYFNLATLNLGGFRSLLGWTHLLAQRVQESASLGTSDVRLVTEPIPPDRRRVVIDPGAPPERPPVTAEERRMPGDNRVGCVVSSRTTGVDDLRTDAGEPAAPGERRHRVVPILSGRFLVVSNGSCNQVLLTYVPMKIVTRIATMDLDYWTRDPGAAFHRPGHNRLWRTLHYLWRVNEHLWYENLYANPSFTYYVGHTSHALLLPAPLSSDAGETGAREGRLARLLDDWNVWLRRDRETDGDRRLVPFLRALVDAVDIRRADADPRRREEGDVRFFCHKVVVMHPYTDESILSNLLAKVAGWGEQSAAAVDHADAACDEWLDGKKAVG